MWKKGIYHIGEQGRLRRAAHLTPLDGCTCMFEDHSTKPFFLVSWFKWEFHFACYVNSCHTVHVFELFHVKSHLSQKEL